MVFQRDESSYRLTALEDEWAAACDEQNVTWPPHRYDVLDRPSGKACTGRTILDCIENEAFAIVMQPRQAHIAFSFEHHIYRTFSQKPGKIIAHVFKGLRNVALGTHARSKELIARCV